MSKRVKAPKRGFLDGYRTYDDSAGRGSPDEWRGAFGRRMGLDEAEGILGSDSPWAVLGISPGASLEQVKKAWRRAAHKWHPDRNGGSEDAAKRFIRANAAYVKLSTPSGRRSR